MIETARLFGTEFASLGNNKGALGAFTHLHTLVKCARQVPGDLLRPY
jgi:hypothetical protein